MQLAIPAWMVVLGTVLGGSGLMIGGLSALRLRRLQAKHARFLAEGLADLNRLGRLENHFFLAVSWVLAGATHGLAGLLSLIFSGLPVSALPVTLGLAAAILLMIGALVQASATRTALLALIAPRSDKAVDSHDALRRLTPRFHADFANRMAFQVGEATEDARKLAAIADHPGAFWPRIDALPGHSVRSRLAALGAGVGGLWRKGAVAGILASVVAFPALPPLPSPLAVWDSLTSPPEPEDTGAETEAPVPDEAPVEDDAGSNPSQREGPQDEEGTGADQGTGETGEGSGDGATDGAEGEGGEQTGEGQGEAPGGSEAQSGETEAGSGEPSGQSEEGSEGEPGDAGPSLTDAATGGGPADAPGSTGGSEQGNAVPAADPGGDEAEDRAPGQGAEGEGTEQPGEGQAGASAGPDAGSGAEGSVPDSSGESPGQAGEAPEQGAGGGTDGQGETTDVEGGPAQGAGATGSQEPADPPASGAATQAEATEAGAAGERVEAVVPGGVGGDPVDEPPGLELLVRPEAPSAESEAIDMTLQATGWAGETDTPAETRPDVQGFAAPGGMAETLVATPPSVDLPDIGAPRTQQSPEQPVPTWIRGLFGP